MHRQNYGMIGLFELSYFSFFLLKKMSKLGSKNEIIRNNASFLLLTEWNWIHQSFVCAFGTDKTLVYSVWFDSS